AVDRRCARARQRPGGGETGCAGGRTRRGGGGGGGQRRAALPAVALPASAVRLLFGAALELPALLRLAVRPAVLSRRAALVPPQAAGAGDLAARRAGGATEAAAGAARAEAARQGGRHAGRRG